MEKNKNLSKKREPQDREPVVDTMESIKQEFECNYI
jgi:hypothetical protein